MYILTYSDDELKHFGVKGMKWGVRNSKRLNAAKYQLQRNARSFTKGLKNEPVDKEYYKKSKEVSFKDATTGRKIARTAVAVATLGTGRWGLRFAAKHRNGIRAANIALGAANGVATYALNKAAGTGAAAAAVVAAKTTGQGIVSAYLSSGLASLAYDALYREGRA